MTNANLMAGCLTLRRGLFIATFATVASISVAVLAANAAETDAKAGKQIFQQNCTACHTIGGGNLVGPDLKGITIKRPREWLQHWIAAPDEMLAKKDPVATGLLHEFHDIPMPNLGLSPSDIAAILAFLETTAPSASAPPPASVSVSPAGATAPAIKASAVTGNPQIGKDLFTGVARFRNGGPPCMACHSVAGIGALGGGQLGPDLTTVVTRYGGAVAVAAFVGGSPTPTMNAVWLQHPLTPDERANVVAFLAQATVSQRPAEAIWQLAVLAVAGLAILLVIVGWLWRGRLSEVRRPMIAKKRHARG